MAPAVESNGDRYHKDFTLSITRALGDQLADALKSVGRAPLTETYIGRVAPRPGVYQLYLEDEFVYVGKADKALPDRLRNHIRKLSGRRGLSLSDVTFSCLYVAEDFSALAPERLLINHYKEAGGIPWNSAGFGNKDPGKNRDQTVLKANHFDLAYPIDLHREVEGLTPGSISVHDLLKRVKGGLPYNFRYKNDRRFKNLFVDLPPGDLTADRIFRTIAGKIQEPWQIAALSGYVIMYDESPATYPSAFRYYRGRNVVEASPEHAPAGNIEEDDEETEG